MGITLSTPARVLPTLFSGHLIDPIKSGRMRGFTLPIRPYSNLRRDDAVWIKEAYRVMPRQHQRDKLWLSYGNGEPACPVDWRPGFAKPAAGLRPAEGMTIDCSRLTLIVETVKVVRLLQLSDDEALSCGVSIEADNQFGALSLPYSSPYGSAQEAALTNHSQVHGCEDENPEVTFITFRSLLRNVRRIYPEVRQ